MSDPRPLQRPHRATPSNESRAITCPLCGSQSLLMTWQKFANNTRHIRATCRHCGRFVRYAVQTPDNIRRADNETQSAGDQQ